MKKYQSFLLVLLFLLCLTACGQKAEPVSNPGSTQSNTAAEATAPQMSTQGEPSVYPCSGDVYHKFTVERTISTGCSTPDIVLYSCSCGYVAAAEIPMSAQQSLTVVQEQQASCLSDGFRVSYCEKCGSSYQTAILRSESSHRGEAQQAAFSCTETHISEEKCSLCGDTYTCTQFPTGHNYAPAESLSVNTVCDEPVEISFACTDCGNTVTVAALQAVHRADSMGMETTAAGCEATGAIRYSCEDCGESIEFSLPAAGHQYQVTLLTDATCSSDGGFEAACSACGQMVACAIPAREHYYSADNIVRLTAATCKAEGLLEYRCLWCKEKCQKKIPKLEHNYEEVSCSATCQKVGVVTYKCTECGQKITEKKLLPHTVSADGLIVAPTCTVEGQESGICTVCGKEFTQSVAATGHAYRLSGSSYDNPCVEGIWEAYTCENCGDSYRNTLAEPGHLINHDTAVNTATCTAAGSETGYCRYCFQLITVEAPIKGHSYQVTDSKERGCKWSGYVVYTCSVCGDSYTETTPAVGHHVSRERNNGAYCIYCGLQTGG